MGLYFNIALFLNFDKIENKNIFFIGTILEKSDTKENYTKYLIRINKIQGEKYLKNFKCYIKTKKELSSGNIIIASGSFERGEESRNYKGFNYRKYLLQKKIFGIIEITNIDVKNNSKNFEIFFYKLKEKIIYSIETNYEEEKVSKLLTCILIGKNIDDKEIIENFKSSNLSHILAISGLHVSYVIMVVKSIKIKNRNLKYYIELICLNIYLIITGISVSCFRACIMNSIFIISKLTNRKNNIYITTFNVFIFSIIYNIYNLQNAGMWLSFAGMLGIILFHKFIYKVTIIKFKIKNKIIKKIVEISCISISAHILIFPIMIYFFNSILFNFIISNLATYYLIGPIIILGYLNIFLYFLKSNICIEIIKWIETFLVKILFFITKIISDKFNFTFHIVTPSLITIFIYYLLIIIVIYTFKKNKFKLLKKVLRKNNYKMSFNNINKILEKIIKKDFYFNKENIKKINALIILVIIFFSIFYNDYYNVRKELKVNFIDVGQGDSSFIITPNNKKILIDGGEGNNIDKYDYGKNVVFPYLLDRKVSKINYIFISHFDSDHVGRINIYFK